MPFVLDALSLLVLVSMNGLAPAPQPPFELVVQSGHTAEVRSVTLSADGTHLLTGSADRTAILWEATTGRNLRTFQGHTAPVTSVALNGDGKLVVTGSEDRTAILWEVATGKKLQTFQEPNFCVESVALSGDGKHVVTGSSNGTAILWQ